MEIPEPPPPALRDIKLSVLRGFRMRHAHLLLEIEKRGSILHAARALGISQPAATKLLRALEQDLGLRLFNRTNRGVEPTEYGAALLRHCGSMVSQLSRAAADLDELSRGNDGHVTVGTLLAGSALVLPTVIARMRRRQPGISVRVREGTIDVLLDGLRGGEIDVIIGRFPVRPTEGNVGQKPLYEGRISVVARAGHGLARKRRLGLADLAGRDWILPPAETTLRAQFDRAFRAAGLAPPRCSVESVSFLINRHLLIRTDLIGIMPHHVVEPDVAAGLLHALPISLPFSFDPFGIIFRTDRTPRPAVGIFTEELEAFAAELEPPSLAAPARAPKGKRKPARQP